MTAIKGAAAAITGAAGGIGRALALEMVSRGVAALALADRDEAGLRAVAAEIGAKAKVTTHRVDVGDAEQIKAFAEGRSRPTRRLTSSSTTPALRCSASSPRSSRRRWSG